MGKPKKRSNQCSENLEQRLAEAEGFEKEIFAILGLEWSPGCKCGSMAQDRIRQLLSERDMYRAQQDSCRQTPAWACDHANEVPCSCPCASNCYCKSHTCRGRQDMKSANLEKYLDLRKKLLEHRQNNRDYDVYGTKAYKVEDDILDEMDHLWYKQLSDAEREFLNTGA